MKYQNLQITLAFLLTLLVCNAQESGVRWQVKNESPAYGITLGYSLPGDQLQAIIGDKFKPHLNEDGNGYLMLFIAISKQYNLDSTSYDTMTIAHILISSQGSLNSPLVIAGENQQINKIFTMYDFKVDIGKIELEVEHKGDSILTEAAITTEEGVVRIKATFLNNPGESVTIESAKVSAPANPTSFFKGGESYRPIQIDSAVIENEGENWITQLNLPSKPDKIWLSVDFVWDFIFTRE
ncbi:hypothetical protein [Lutibacter sp.]|uniref:hypothetical protein n=1 Tax=Lutibacter sp. TaxID=1925666 RepID=UPI00273295C4|nr:hypothetical protein [Lutibacter sp.]MDP3312752.1 hypothetical protein [Lutibacter sp.]